MSTLHAVIYVRLSSYRGPGDPSTSPERQREVCTAYATAKGWTVVDVVEDLDVSGSDRGMRLDRPGLSRVRSSLPDVDVVLFSKLDRLARNVADFHRFGEEAAEHGVALVSVAESLDLTTPSGRFVATILAAFAEMEAQVIADRAREGRSKARELGRWTGGRVPYGVRPVPNPDTEVGGKVLEVNPIEADMLREVLAKADSGWSWPRIARWLNEGDLRPRTAKHWSATSVRTMMQSATVMEYVFNAEERRTARRVTAAASPGERRHTGGHLSRLLSGGLLVCDSCGRTLLAVGAREAKAGGRGTPMAANYRCSSWTAGTPCEAPSQVKAERVEDFVVDRWLAGWGAFAETETYRPSDAVSRRLAELSDREAEILTALPRASRDLRGNLLAELTAVEAESDNLTSEPATDLTVLRETGRTYADVWVAADIEGRRELLRKTAGPLRLRRGLRGGNTPMDERVVNHYRLDGPGAIDEHELDH